MADQAPPPPDPNAPLSGSARFVDEVGLKAIVWTCFSVASIFVTLRLTVRWRQNRMFLADDYLIGWAWVCALAMAICQTMQMPFLWYMTYLTAGRVPIAEDIIYKSSQLATWQFPIIKLFWTILWTVKFSFLAIFYRLVKPFPVQRYAWYAIAVFTFLAYVGCWISSTLTCTPPGDYFKGSGCDSDRDKWMQRFNVIYSTSVDVTTDLMIVALPITILPSLQLDLRKKIGLGIAFSLGAIIICVAIVRMTQVIVGEVVDLVGLAIWGAVETCVAIVVGSLPPLKSLLSRGVKKYSSKKSSQRYAAGVKSDTQDRYAPGSHSRTVMVTESIPLDDMHKSSQLDGRIYVQRAFETHVDYDNSSREYDDEVAIVKGHAR